jgi:hypothetical protein
VVFGEPVALVAERLGAARQVDRVVERLRGAAAFDDRRQVEYGKFGQWIGLGCSGPI